MALAIHTSAWFRSSIRYLIETVSNFLEVEVHEVSAQ